MPKQKTHRATLKKLNVRPGGTITRGSACGNHKTGKRSTDAVRDKKKGSTLSRGDYRRIKSIL